MTINASQWCCNQTTQNVLAVIILQRANNASQQEGHHALLMTILWLGSEAHTCTCVAKLKNSHSLLVGTGECCERLKPNQRGRGKTKQNKKLKEYLGRQLLTEPVVVQALLKVSTGIYN